MAEGHQGFLQDFRQWFLASLCSYGSEAPTLLCSENLVCRKENLDHEWAVFAGLPTSYLYQSDARLLALTWMDLPKKWSIGFTVSMGLLANQYHSDQVLVLLYSSYPTNLSTPSGQRRRL
jgi:hypothetical protein